MRRDNLIRLIALIVLSALVYFFSFDQGRDSVQPRIERLQTALRAKERTIEQMAVEIDRLKKELEAAAVDQAADDGPAEPLDGKDRVSVRLNASRVLFDGRVVLTCLGIDREGRQARLQVNLVGPDKLVTQTVGLGQTLRLEVGGQELIIILEQIHSTFVSVKLISG